MTSHRSVRRTAYFVLGTSYLVHRTWYIVSRGSIVRFFCLRTRVRIPERRGGHGARGSSPAFPWPSVRAKKSLGWAKRHHHGVKCLAWEQIAQYHA